MGLLWKVLLLLLTLHLVTAYERPIDEVKDYNSTHSLYLRALTEPIIITDPLIGFQLDLLTKIFKFAEQSVFYENNKEEYNIFLNWKNLRDSCYIGQNKNLLYAVGTHYLSCYNFGMRDPIWTVHILQQKGGYSKRPPTPWMPLVQDSITNINTILIDQAEIDGEVYDDQFLFSGNVIKGSFDRGHLVPNGDMDTKPAREQTFRALNEVPQNSQYNQFYWRCLEQSIRGLRERYKLIIFTFPIYETPAAGEIFTVLRGKNKGKLLSDKSRFVPNKMMKIVYSVGEYHFMEDAFCVMLPNLILQKEKPELPTLDHLKKCKDILNNQQISISSLPNVVDYNYEDSKLQKDFESLLFDAKKNVRCSAIYGTNCDEFNEASFVLERTQTKNNLKFRFRSGDFRCTSNSCKSIQLNRYYVMQDDYGIYQELKKTPIKLSEETENKIAKTLEENNIVLGEVDEIYDVGDVQTLIGEVAFFIGALLEGIETPNLYVYSKRNYNPVLNDNIYTKESLVEGEWYTLLDELMAMFDLDAIIGSISTMCYNPNPPPVPNFQQSQHQYDPTQYQQHPSSHFPYSN